MGEKHENTNLASEFCVLSMLYRKGFNASLTLGNKKAVDIVVVGKKKNVTIDVKGIRGSSNSFPVDNLKKGSSSHFIIFVSFADMGNHRLLENNPEVYVVPSSDLKKTFHELKDRNTCKGELVYHNPKETRKVVELGRLRQLSARYRDRWELLKQA